MKNQKIVICFAGLPGTGKSAISVQVASEIRGIVLDLDEYKKSELEIVKSISKMASRGVITEKIANKITPKLSERNKKLLNIQLKQLYLK